MVEVQSEVTSVENRYIKADQLASKYLEGKQIDVFTIDDPRPPVITDIPTASPRVDPYIQVMADKFRPLEAGPFIIPAEIKTPDQPVPEETPALYVVASELGSRSGQIIHPDTKFIPNSPSNEKIAHAHSYFGTENAPHIQQTILRDPAYQANRILRISFERANEVTVVEGTEYQKAYDQTNVIGKDAELKKTRAARVALAKTATPLLSYMFNFEKPIYVVNREFGANEVEDITDQVRIFNIVSKQPMLDFSNFEQAVVEAPALVAA